MSILRQELTIPAAAWLLLLCALTVAVYWPGIHGPFLFDDEVHIVHNDALAIHDLSPSSLYQAWCSSPFNFPASRPLSMLTFGVNRALTGLDPFWFKLTNLGIHLLNGLLVFALVRLIGDAMSRVSGRSLDPATPETWAILTSALWLLHPINLTSVLYTVQRMNSLSALFMLSAMVVYMRGRLRMLDGPQALWPVAALSLTLGGVGFLAKENAVLLPGFLLLLDWLFLGFRAQSPQARRQVIWFFVGVVGIPFVAGVAYILTHLGWVTGSYGGRTFTFEQRVLTEPRVLWFYLQNLLIPDYRQLGLYHDDFILSHSLTHPPSTLAAILGLGGLASLGLALGLTRRAPVLAFGILFFLLGHSLESSIIPLEVVFEHRNYLPGVGVLAVLAYGIVRIYAHPRMRVPATVLGLALIMVGAGNTLLRAKDWRSETDFVLAEVAHHPDSPRANFQTGQQLIAILPRSKHPDLVYKLARQHLEHAVELRPANADGLFGLIVLNLYAGKPPETTWIKELEHRLRDYPYSAENVTTEQFSYLVRWHMQVPAPRLSREQMLGIFDAVLANPRLDRYARAGIHSALRAYYDSVLKDPQKALENARAAAQAWPEHWAYHDRLIRLLVRLGRSEEAKKALRDAMPYALTEQLQGEAAGLRRLIEEAPAPAPSSSTLSVTP